MGAKIYTYSFWKLFASTGWRRKRHLYPTLQMLYNTICRIIYLMALVRIKVTPHLSAATHPFRLKCLPSDAKLPDLSPLKFRLKRSITYHDIFFESSRENHFEKEKLKFHRSYTIEMSEEDGPLYLGFDLSTQQLKGGITKTPSPWRQLILLSHHYIFRFKSPLRSKSRL